MTSSTFLELAEERQSLGECPAFTFLEGDERRSLSYRELLQKAGMLAGHIQRHALAGDRVLLVYPPGQDYVVAFIAAVLAGVVAVPAVSPSSLKGLPRLELIASDSGARLVLTTSALAERLANFGGPMAALARLETDTDLGESAWQRPQTKPQDLLFLQYTSGSTGDPKGVMISHANAMANLAHCQATFGLVKDDVIVSWLPPHHDFGLVGGILSSIFVGAHAVHLTPLAFLTRPLRWLQAINDFRATVTGAPNFAWELCSNRITEEQRAGLDLSSLRVAINGAERVRAETIETFCQSFASCDFNPGAVTPAYGLAEATLLVSALRNRRPGLLPRRLSAREGMEDSLTHRGDLVTNGNAADVVIVGADGQVLPDGEIGEIWLRGPSVAQGYWGKPQESARVFGQSVAGQGGYMRSGDLGFIEGGELFVSGRLRELITVGGRNIFPQDIEPDVEALNPGFRPSGCAVVGIEQNGVTQLVILQEVLGKRDLQTDGLIEQIRAMLAEKHEVADLAGVVLLRTGDLPRTTSGKIQRYRASDMYLRGQFVPVWQWQAGSISIKSDFVAPRTPIEVRLADLWSGLLEMDKVSVTDNFMELSGNSLLATQVVSALYQQFGVEVSLRALFENPTIAQLALEIERAQEQQAAHAEATSAPARQMPISRGQVRMFYLDQFAPGEPIYNRRRTLALDGEIAVDVLSRAATELARRHEILRYRFDVTEGSPTAWLMPLTAVEVTRIAARHMADAKAKAQSFADSPFHLMTGPLFRIGLISEDEDTHLLVLALHASIADEASVDIALNELAVFYSAYSDGFATPLSAPKLQHADLVRWQDGWMQGAVLDGQIGWWRERLDGAPAALALPFDHIRPPVQTHAGARHVWFIPHRASETELGSAFAILLHRFSGQSDISIGLELPQRSLDGAAGLLGPLVNLAVLRLTVETGMTISEVTRNYEEALADVREHGATPFDLIVEAMQPERRLNQSPLFQVLLRLQPDEMSVPLFNRAKARTLPDDLVRSEYDLTLTLRATSGGIEAGIDYAADLFEPATITRMAEAFDRILSQMALPDQDVLAKPLLSDASFTTVVNDWNDVGSDYPELAPIPVMFEEQVRRRPDAECVRCGDQTLTFAELNTRANRLARGLRDRGVGPDDRVGLCAERSVEMMVALVGILKAGAAYVPLDPALPADRLAYMAHDAGVAIVLTTGPLSAALPPLPCPLFLLDRDFATLPDDTSDLGVAIHPQNLVYIIYTSGSTGQPKGVAVPHGGVANRLVWMTHAYGVTDDERVMQKTPYSFDVSVWELFWPLIAGATLVMAKPGGHQDVAYMAGLIRDERITTMHFVPPMLEFFLTLADLDGAGSLRQVLCSGQALPVALQNRFFEMLPGVKLRNMYGPTETCVEISAWNCTPVDGQMTVPIGRPIANNQMYILDAAMNPVPVGVAGELMLAGAHLARGYLNRPDLTADKFMPNPFGAPGARLYKSGDLARFLADGTIEYLGRIDDQVKIRGFRIELGEIEARLRAQPGVRDALVMARDDIANDRRLVAYVVAASDAAPDEAALRSALLATLPDYMVPAHFVWLDAFPVTLNGKVNRKALPLPVLSRDDEGYVAPEGDIAQALAEIWAQLLGLDRVGTTDSFFALGGHSLLATQAISKIRSRFGVDVPLRAILFDQPTIADLAPLIEDLVATQAGTVMTTIQPTDRTGELDLSFSQKRLWFLDQLEPGNPFYNIPAPTRLQGELDVEALRAALNQIVRRHDILRTRFITRDARPIQVIQPEFELDIPVVDLSHLPHETALTEARRLAVADAQTSFDLEAAPPLRATLLRLRSDDHVILFNMHHILSDGWSMGVLVTEFVAIYRAFSAGEPDPLPPLPIQYVDFAAWQRNWLQGDTLQQQLAYWSGQLQDAPPILALPTDMPRPAAQSYRGATHDMVIPAQVVSELYALGARHQSTLYMVLLSAFNILLSRYSRQQDICVGTYIANRNRAEIEQLIGFFVNTLVLRNSVDPKENFADLLRNVRHTLLDAYANQDLPFEYLVDHLNPERHLSHSPLVQVAFVLQNTPMDDLDASGLKTEPLVVESSVSKFDLTLRLTEKNGQLEGCLEYATDLFQPETIARMASQFAHLLQAVVRAPSAPLEELSLIPEAEVNLLAGLASGPDVDVADLPLVLDAFAAQAQRAPDQIAVDGLTYADLDRRSTILAHRMVARGVGRGDVVGLWLGRGEGFVTSILASIKVGATWLPLDPQVPTARRDFILGDARPRLVLTDSTHRPDLPNLLLIDADEVAPACALPGVSPQDPAYILYTSGTTGTPKGVCVPHLAVMNHAAHHMSLCGLGPKDKVLQFAATGFDTAVEEIIPTLMAGASLVSRPEGFLDTGRAFDALLDENAITIVDLPTQFWHQWAQDTTGLPGSLRLVVLGGEALTGRQVSDWSARPDTANVRLINTYGPTETAIIVTAQEIDHGPALADPPLGRAIPGVTLRLFDHRFTPVPVGIPGEIFLGGHCLAQGYLNRPDLTAERFVADPFGAPDARLYRTGDLARLSADGTVRYLGRTDDQIKLRGFRIEPAEVEAALLDLGASAALVTLHVDYAGSQQLLAYVTGAEEAALLPALRQRLPSYMVPWRILELGQFPLTTNGKIDRRALPKPARVESQAGPRDALTQKIAAIWGEVLSHAPESMADDENFFALGGHSLLATQVISKIRTQFAMDLPLRALFEHPTIGGLASTVAAAQAQAPSVTATIPALGPADAYELSFAQQRLWFLDQLDPDSPHYTIPAALRLKGELNHAALQSAFEAVLARHSVLRGRIRVQDHHPQMTVTPPSGFDLPLEDLGHLPAEDALNAAVSRCAKAALQRFDLTDGELVRAQLLRLAPSDHVLILTMHHIVADGWSIGVLVAEIAALYASFQHGQPDPLPPLGIQYSDFAAWQRDWLAGGELQRQVDYWKDQLADAPSLLALPTDRPRPAVQSHKGASLDFSLPPDLVDALRRVGRAKGATLFMVMQAALATLLHRLSGETDILIGTPIANRNRAELEPLIGFFVNTLVLRNHVSPDMRFADLLDQSHNTALAAYGHQDVPFEHLVEVLRPERHLSHSPLFQVMLALQNAPLGDIALEGLDIAPMALPSVSAKFDLTVSLQEVAGGLDGNIEYATDLFDAATVERMTTQFRNLLAAIAADITVGISDLPLLTEADQNQILESFNQPDPALPSAGGQDVLSRIAGFAASAPGATALVLQDQRLDYATLDAKANGLARVLAKHGVGPETVVGIAAERSFEMVIALLAVLKAGGGYLPLDPDYPDQRLTYMIEDAAPRLILASPSLVGKLSGFGPDVLALDLTDIAGHSDAPNVAIHPQSCGYLIYTSGSTGRPKGVTLTRAGLENLIQWQLATGPVPDAVLQFASLNFDVSFQEIFSTLAAGKTLVLLPPGLNRDLEAVLDYSRKHRVGRMFLPNAVLQQMLALPQPAAEVSHPCEIISAGEALSTADHRMALLRLLNGAALFNQYGPSETHVVTQEPLPSSEAANWADRPAIGRPIWNARTYVLSPGLEPVPVGVWGQLFIGGMAPARGYHARPDATAEKFLPDPFGTMPGARMYATGDTVRWLADGRIEFRGREDDQVKVNGIRVELGEIETALKSLPDVQDATVMQREDRPGLRQIVAYFVSDSQSPDSLRQALQALLPGYMVPAFFVPLSSLPLTVNGKVDRRALPVPAVSVGGGDGLLGGVGLRVAGIWGEVLGLSAATFGGEENFFALGGHSLLATQVISKIRAGFGVEMPLRALFEQPTIRGLAALIEAEMLSGEAALPAPVAEPRVAGGPQGFPLSFAQARLWFLDQLAPGDLAYSLPVALAIEGPLDVSALAAAFGGLVARHEVLRSRFVLQGGAPVQIIDPVAEGPFELPLTDLGAGLGAGEMLEGLSDADRQEAVAAAIQAEAGTSFQLAQGPLLRARLLALGRDSHVLIVNMHHIVSDGWSMGVLLREIAHLYEAHVAGRTPDLPPLPVQYADYAQWQRDWLQGAALDRQLAYWQGHLKGLPGLLALPTDRPRPPVQSHRGAALALTLDAGLVARLEALGRAQGATLHMVLTGVLSVLLARWSGQDDIAIGTPVAGRRHEALEGLIGFFVNTLVLRTRIDPEEDFAALLDRVRDDALEGLAHQDLPFEHLVEAMAPARDLSHAPLFQVMLALQNAPLGEMGFGGLSLSPIGFDASHAKFDITLSLQDDLTGPASDGGHRALSGTLEYATDLFDAATMARLAGQFVQLARAVADAPRQPCATLPLMSAEDRDRTIAAWAAKPGPETTRARTGQTLAQLFEDAVRRWPERTALRHEGTSIGYDQLNRRANQMAHHLMALGAGPDQVIGICTQRCPEMIVAILAILKAGAAYLPLDPDHPDDRIAYMLADANPGIVLTTPDLTPRLETLTQASILDLTQPLETPDTNTKPKTTPNNLAYVIYTSGSTGKPKGTMVENRAIVNRVVWLDHALEITPEDRIIQKTPYGFDVSVGEIFLPLIAGGTLVIARPAGHIDVSYLANLIRTEKATIAHFVAPVMEASLAVADPADYASLRFVMCSGQALPRAAQDRFGQILPHVRMHNLYGPTEAAVEVTHWPCDASDPRTGPGVPIGRPIDNVTIYILDDDLNPVPQGVPGHLYIGGVALARGYLNRPDLTAGVFVPDPFGPAGARMYRSGDRARYLPNGAVDYMGRSDDQMKVRGVRMEPGEIEAAILACGYREAAVLAGPDASGELGVLAYVVAPSIDEPDLRERLSGLIPDHMMPSAFMAIKSLPLTPNGKLDRKALPKFDFDTAATFVAPRTPTEVKVAAIWAEVLGREQVGIADNFFKLGGQSLKAVTALNMIRQTFSVELGLEKAFALQTVGMLARHVDGLIAARTAAPKDPARKTMRI